MSPGINNRPRSTGTTPKSNRRSDRNGEGARLTFNQSSPWIRRAPETPAQHANNLFQLDWHPRSETPSAIIRASATKKSNSRPTYAAVPSSSSYSCDLGDLGPYSSHSRLFPNICSREDFTSTFKMSPPVDSPTQSPLNLPTKATNTDKMPERAQVEGRLNQIREYIKVTSTMMDSLSQSSDTRAQAQHEKLGRMLEDLYDSDRKLSKLVEECQKYWIIDENGYLGNGTDRNREFELRKKVEESQHKLAQLQEHQAQLVGMQLQVRQRLDEARQARRTLLAGEVDQDGVEDEDEEQQEEEQPQETMGNADQLEHETEALRDKLQQLEQKKRQMDQIMQELQNAERLTHSPSSSDPSKITGQRDKVAELEAMKAQLAHLKAMMNETSLSVFSDPDIEHPMPSFEPGDAVPNGEQQVSDDVNQIDYISNGNYSNSLNDSDDILGTKRSSNLPTVEQIHAVTRELKEHHQQLQATRAELQRLKQGHLPSTVNPSPPITSSTPPPLLGEKKQSNNNNTRQTQNKCRQLEDFMRKDHTRSASINQNGVPEWSSRRGSTSYHSHVSTSGNQWSLNANQATESHEPNIDSVSATENQFDNGPQNLMENGFGGNNFWGMPSMLATQPSQGTAVGSAEYYKQLLLGSQAQQLQMMSTTVQQCCQLLWSQQREMQSMRSAITQLQAQMRHLQTGTGNNLDLQVDQHSNLGRATMQQQQHFSALDVATLPPSSSLPNLVSLPNSSPAPSPSVVSTSGNCQQQQQQLNNQVPPGNRANNYWDNFRSYSRQNLLSGSSKAALDCTASPSAHPTSTNTSNGIIGGHMSKFNRQNGQENLSMPPSMAGSMDTQYSLNFQTQSNSHHSQTNSQQPQNREPTSSTLNNYLMNNDELPQQQVSNSQQTENVNNEVTQSASSVIRIREKLTERDVLKLILTHCKKALQIGTQNESPVQSSNVSNSSDSSDDEDEGGYQISAPLPNIGNIENQAEVDVLESASSVQEIGFFANATNVITFTSSSIPHVNENLTEIILLPTNQRSSEDGVKCVGNEESSIENASERVGLQSPVSCNLSSTSLKESEVYDDLNAEDEEIRAEYVMFDQPQNSPPPQHLNRSQNRVPDNSLTPRLDDLQK